MPDSSGSFNSLLVCPSDSCIRVPVHLSVKERCWRERGKQPSNYVSEACSWEEEGHKSGKDVLCQGTQIKGRGPGHGQVGREAYSFPCTVCLPANRSHPHGGISSEEPISRWSTYSKASLDGHENAFSLKRKNRTASHMQSWEKREMQTEMPPFWCGSCSFRCVTCQLSKQKGFPRVPKLNDFHVIIQSLLVLQNIAALDNTLYSVNSVKRVESSFEWEWIWTWQ